MTKDTNPSGEDLGTLVNITILMATYNGGEWLKEQLASFSQQTHPSWQLLVSDDASTDQTRSLVHDFLESHAGHCLDGPEQGGAENFRSLLLQAQRFMPQDGWLAFSDQDDVWMPDRLERGVTRLSNVAENQPALYCSRTWVVDAELQHPQLSAPRPRAPGFRNALVQNIAAGNTILVNAAGAELLCDAAADADGFVVHDWWAYQVIAGAGGAIIHDDEPTLYYRQHDGNSIGANLGARAQLVRFLALFKGELRSWNARNIPVLMASSARFTDENRKNLFYFKKMHQGGLWSRLVAQYRLRPYRQTRLGTIAIWISAILKRV